MRILIDLTQIPLQKVGVGVYAENLVRELLLLDDKNFYLFLIQDDDDSFAQLPKRANTLIVSVKANWFRRLPLRFAMEQLYIPLLTVKHRIDVVHSLHYSFPLFAWAKRVVTIHDLTFFLFPELHTPFKVLYFRFFIRLASKFADHLIFDSKASLEDFVRVLQASSANASVVYLGIPQNYRDQARPELLKELRAKKGLGLKYLLFLGTIEPRKNLIRLILAFEKLLAAGFDGKLVLAGKRGWHCDELDLLLSNKPNLLGKVVFTGYIAEEEKAALLSGALVFVYPSLYEGFGIPVLEALAFGIPTITSNVSSLVEVAGDAALLVEPTSEEEIYESMRLLTNDEKLRTDLRRKSIQQSQKFNWSKAAAETSKIYFRVR